MVDFDAGRRGIFHWTSVGYDSPLRWWRSSRFLADKGMGITVGTGLDVEERVSLLAPGREAPSFVTLERRWERIARRSCGGTIRSRTRSLATAHNGTTTRSAWRAASRASSMLCVMAASRVTVRTRRA